MCPPQAWKMGGIPEGEGREGRKSGIPLNFSILTGLVSVLPLD